MIRTALIAASAIFAAIAATSATAEPVLPVHKANLTAPGHWAVVRVGEQKVTHCMVGVRSDAAAPQPGQPQFVITADNEFAILRVRAAEWSFSGSRRIAVTLAAGTGMVREPVAVVHGADLIDIALGAEAQRMNELAAAGNLEIRAEGTVVSLPLRGLAGVLPAYRDCLSSIGQPVKNQMQASIR
jgi:hypothetical protein